LKIQYPTPDDAVAVGIDDCGNELLFTLLLPLDVTFVLPEKVIIIAEHLNNNQTDIPSAKVAFWPCRLDLA